MVDETQDTARTNVESELPDEIASFRTAVETGGFGHLYGLYRTNDETDEAFKSRIIERMTAQPKTRQEYNDELCAFLKDHFFDRLCWWAFSNGGDDFSIDITENNQMPFCIEIKVYPGGKPDNNNN